MFNNELLPDITSEAECIVNQLADAYAAFIQATSEAFAPISAILESLAATLDDIIPYPTFGSRWREREYRRKGWMDRKCQEYHYIRDLRLRLPRIRNRT